MSELKMGDPDRPYPFFLCPSIGNRHYIAIFHFKWSIPVK